ncbi:MAG: SLBB domain-containing protein [candidate division WOR-3 bacterium]|nr:MAG: SLBB domain-containing protein [candidate division WOR-3 bacterium]
MKKLLLLIMFFIVGSVNLDATEVEITSSPGQDVDFPKPVVSDKEYMLMPGDSLLVTVTGATNYSYITGVTYEGKLTLNMPVASVPTLEGTFMPHYDVVAAIPVYGLSLKTAKDSVAKAFSRYLRNFNVDLTLIGMRTFDVLVVGEVTNPGVVPALPIYRVSMVIDEAGGINAIGSRANIELRRRGRFYANVNLAEFDRTGNVRTNPYVQDGDVIIVPQMENSVVVKGAVFGKREYELRVAELTAAREKSSEGLYELLEGERAADLIVKAGGLTPWADPAHTYIERNGEKLYVNLLEVLSDTSSQQNIRLKNGDVLVIPSVNSVVYVQGQVATPGAFPFQPNLRASDYIGIAGGPLGDASMGSAYVKRGTKKLDTDSDPLIEEGDIIYIPRQVFKFWQDYLEITAVIASLLISYLTLTK